MNYVTLHLPNDARAYLSYDRVTGRLTLIVEDAVGNKLIDQHVKLNPEDLKWKPK